MIEALLSVLLIEGFMEVLGVLCATFILIGSWLQTKEAKLLPTVVSVVAFAVGQELFRFLYFRSIAQIYLKSPMVTLIAATTALSMMLIGYCVAAKPTGRETVEKVDLIIENLEKVNGAQEEAFSIGAKRKSGRG